MRDKLQQLELNNTLHKEALRKLMSTPFDIHNMVQNKQLSHYLNKYELNLNQMYLYQGLSSGITAWLSSYAINIFIPTPGLMRQTSALLFYIGFVSSLLEQFNNPYFLQQHQEMKELYNWCLKNNEQKYNATIDNTAKLATPIMQRFITLLAPLCDPSFMIVWPRNEVLNHKATANLYNRFFASPKSQEQQCIEKLKLQVEQKQFDQDTLERLKHAVHYFTSKEGLTELQKTILDMIPNVIKDSVAQIIPYNLLNKR